MMYSVIFPISSNFPIVSTIHSEIKYYTLGNKDHSRKLLWAALAVTDNVPNVWGTVSPLVVSGSKTFVGSTDEIVFLTAIWLPYSQLWAIIEGPA